MVHIRTVAAILMLFVVALLILNKFLRSEWIWLISIAIMVMAVVIYFIPRLRKCRDDVAIAEKLFTKATLPVAIVHRRKP